MTTPSKPWYRHLWPWLILAGPLAVLIAAGITLHVLGTNFDNPVADDYERQGQEISRSDAREREAARLGLAATIHVSADGRSLAVDTRGTLPAQLTLHLRHPGHADRDQTLLLTRVANNRYQGERAATVASHWHIVLEDASHRWRLAGEWSPEGESAIRLGAAS
ncbi:FixH family protein [Paludibacterium yongneupense]|uniref:FixH family protein n=1 Tax=Paludibacterium yongneupense TaxID=400061 RepID=UPI00040617BF|nr:FixH family protein [Paludibacterium yongneupense]